MTDTDKKTTDKPAVDEPKVADEPKVDEPKVADEPKVEEPQAEEATPEPAGDTAQPAGDVDQHGRQLFETDCSSCGNKTKVPFKPTEGRPVYCRDCFMKQKNDRGPRQY